MICDEDRNSAQVWLRFPRHYVYNADNKCFHTLPPLKGCERCVVTVKHFLHESCLTEEEMCCGLPAANHPILCSTTTDGTVTLWSIFPLLSDFTRREQSPGSAEQLPLLSFRPHQSGINDLAIKNDDGLKTLEHSAVHTRHDNLSEVQHVHAVVCGGEDNALTVTYLSTSANTGAQVSAQVLKKHIHPLAHSSTITGSSVHLYCGCKLLCILYNTFRCVFYRVQLGDEHVC